MTPATSCTAEIVDGEINLMGNSSYAARLSMNGRNVFLFGVQIKLKLRGETQQEYFPINKNNIARI